MNIFRHVQFIAMDKTFLRKKNAPIHLMRFGIAFFGILVFVGCTRITEPEDTGPTISMGPGGPAILIGSVSRGVTIIIYPSSDYSDELSSLTVTSCSDSFKITDLPIDTVDIIAKGSHYFASKKCCVLLEEGENSFSPSLVDTSNLDPQGWPQWVQDEVLITFKDTTVDSLEANSILESYDCLVVEVLCKCLGHQLFKVDIPDDRTVPEMIEMLTLDERVRYACPNHLAYFWPLLKRRDDKACKLLINSKGGSASKVHNSMGVDTVCSGLINQTKK